MNNQKRSRWSNIGIIVYFILLLLPIYWMFNMSLKTNDEILGTFSLWPVNPTLENYRTIFTDEAWYSGYINSITYTVINTVLSVGQTVSIAIKKLDWVNDKFSFSLKDIQPDSVASQSKRLPLALPL